MDGKYSYKVAVVIPNWNGEQRISVMLDSILNQDFDDWNVFIVDDQSTDRSVEIINNYTKKDPRIHLCVRDKEPKGGQTCRNMGFELTEGAEYVCFFDNDDMIAPYCLRQRTAFMDSHPNIDFAIFSVKAYKDSPYDDTFTFYGGRFLTDDLESFFYRTLQMLVVTNIYRRDNYIEKGLFWDTKLKSMQDSGFNIQAILKGCKYEYTNESLPISIDYFYFIRPKNSDSVSSKISSLEHMNSNLHLINTIINSLDKKQKAKYHKQLQLYILSFIRNANYPTFVQAMLDNPWVKTQTRFWLSLRFWKVLKFHYRIMFYIFKKPFQEMDAKKILWRNYMKEQINKQLHLICKAD